MASISIITINIKRNDQVNFDKFNILPADKKILRLKLEIERICEVLKNTASDQLWIITWREYAITENEHNRALSPANKKLYKQTLHELALKYAPNLVIVAGTVATTKYVTDLSKLEQVKTYYEKHIWLKDIEDKSTSPSPMYYDLAKVEAMLSSSPLPTGVSLIRNTCYVVGSDETLEDEIQRHDKISGFFETSENPQVVNPIFQPAKERNLNQFLKVKHPKTKEEFNILVEICLEHLYSTARRYTQDGAAFIQIIMSDTTVISPEYVIGEFAIQADSLFYPHLITRNVNLNQLNVDHFQVNLLLDNPRLEGPLQAYYPFELRVRDRITAFAQHSIITPDQKKYLQDLNNDFTALSLEHFENYISYSDLLNWLYEQLAESRPIFFTPEYYANKAKNPTLFNKNPIKEFFSDMVEIITSEANKLRSGSDLCSFDSALSQIDMAKFLLQQDNKKIFNFIEKHNLWDQLSLTQDEIFHLLWLAERLPKSEQKKYYPIILNMTKAWINEPIDALDGETLLHAACQGERLLFISCVIEFCKGNIDVRSRQGDTALHSVLYDKGRENDLVIHLLLLAGADISLLSHKNQNAIEIATETGASTDLIELISAFNKASLRP